MRPAHWLTSLRKRAVGALRARLPEQPGSRDTAGPAAPRTAPRSTALGVLLAELAEQPERTPLDPTELLGALREATGTGTVGGVPRPDAVLAPALTVARRLVRQHRHSEAIELTDVILTLLDPPSSSGLQAVAQHARLSLGERPGADLRAVVAATLAGADAAVNAGDLPRAAELVDVGAGLLLHRDLHADPVTSPLVEDPVSFLEPFRESRVMALLAAPPTSSPGSSARERDRSGGASDQLRVVVLTGAYPRFSRPMVEALRQRGHAVEVIDLAADHRPFRWIGTDPDLILPRLRASVTGTAAPDGTWGYGVPSEHVESLRRADVVVADWADKGAVWASVVAPPDARLVVRVHGVDALSLWIHALNWSRVDAVVAVSQHQAGLVDDVLRCGAVARSTSPPPCQPVFNTVSLPHVVDPPARDPWSLGLVGWAKPVKDPLWAVEVLARLRARGGPWSLVLIGEDFTPGGVRTIQQYAGRFRQRIQEPDVAGAVQLVGRTDTVEREVARLGFVLSSSVRESFHLGLAEGVLGGAVPVVRDWPFFASRRGAASLYPADWVVADVDAAVDRIWSLREPERRAKVAHLAQAEAETRFDPDRTGAELVRVITGH